MSRTKRKTDYTESTSLVGHINSELEYRNKCISYVNRGYGWARNLKHANESIEELTSRAKIEYAEFQYDGRFYESGRNSGFKHDSQRTVRNANKRLCHDIMRNEEYDTKPYPGDYMGKTHLWDWW